MKTYPTVMTGRSDLAVGEEISDYEGGDERGKENT